MSKRFITFTPVEGVYKAAIQPYKKWSELADMCPLIEVDGKYYRILRVTGLINKISTRKIVICDEEGKLIENEELTRECLKVMVYLTRFQTSSQGIVAGSEDDSIPKLNNFITELTKILKQAGPHLTHEEREAMNFHLYYYEEMKRLMKIVAEEASELASYIKPLQDNEIELFTPSFVNRLEKHIVGWEVNKGYAEAVMIEDGQKARKLVRKVLRNKVYYPYFSDMQIVEKMELEAHEAEKTVDRFIFDAKQAWEMERKWLNTDKGPFNLEQYLHELWNRNIVEVFREADLNKIIIGYWVFSNRRRYP